MSTSGEPPIAPGLVSAIGAQLREAHAENVAATHASLDGLITKILEEHEADLSNFAAPLLAHLCEHPALSEEVRQTFRTMTKPEHQTQFFTALFAVKSIIDQFVNAGIAPLVQDVSNLAWDKHPVMPLSPSEAALAVLRHTFDPAKAKADANAWGIDDERFAVLVGNTGDTIGLGQLLEAYRRGFIDDKRLERGVEQSRVRDEWVDVIRDLRFVPVPVGEVLAGSVQGHLPLPDAKVRLGHAGIDPDNFDWLYQTHGRPPGVVELGHLVNRGEMTEADWEQAVRESDIKNKYIPFLAKLHRQIMPMRTVVSAVRQAALTPAQGVEKLRQLGYDDADARVLVAEATSAKHQAAKDLTQAQLVNLYADGLITRADAHARVMLLGYDETEAEMVLQLSDHARQARFRASAVNRVHAHYIGYHITKDTASKDLDKIGIDSVARDDLLKLWTNEREANVRPLTEAQIAGLLHRGIITTEQFLAKVQALGYTEQDSHYLYWLAFSPTGQPKLGPDGKPNPRVHPTPPTPPAPIGP